MHWTDEYAGEEEGSYEKISLCGYGDEAKVAQPLSVE
jgi:hypothetical protein